MGEAVKALKPHYSASQLNMFMHCSAQYEFRYLDGLIQAPTSALARGKAYHTGLETNYRQKLVTRKDLEAEAVQQAYVDALEAEAMDVEWSSDEKAKGVRVVKGEMKDAGVKTLEVYLAEKAPSIQPTDVEAEVHLDVGGLDVLGYVDLVDDEDVIHDHKFVSKSPTKSRINGEYIVSQREIIQGAIYLMARPETQGIEFDYGVALKTPKVVTVQADIGERDKRYVENLVGHVDNAINKGIFIPNRNAMMCSRRTCAYWDACEKRFGGRVKA